MAFSTDLSNRREALDRALGRCQCMRPAVCHTPAPHSLAGRCTKRFKYSQSGWLVAYIKRLDEGGTDWSC